MHRQVGVAISSDVDPYVGLGLRLTASSSPLTIQPTFEYVFDEDQTLYHIGGNLLYEVPIAFRFKPYFGVGMRYSTGYRRARRLRSRWWARADLA